MTERLERDTTVLFARILGGADLIAKAGDSRAVAGLGRCLEHITKAAQDCGARVRPLSADKMMVLVATPDAAADAAAAMHTAMDSFPREGGIKLALGIGFHHGPVTQKDDDVYGDTVNLAASLVERGSPRGFAALTKAAVVAPSLVINSSSTALGSPMRSTNSRSAKTT